MIGANCVVTIGAHFVIRCSDSDITPGGKKNSIVKADVDVVK